MADNSFWLRNCSSFCFEAPLELLESWKLCPRVMPYLENEREGEWQGLWENSPTAKPILLERPKRSQSSVKLIFFSSEKESRFDFNGENLVQNLKNSHFFLTIVIINFLVQRENLLELALG